MASIEPFRKDSVVDVEEVARFDRQLIAHIPPNAFDEPFYVLLFMGYAGFGEAPVERYGEAVTPQRGRPYNLAASEDHL